MKLVVNGSEIFCAGALAGQGAPAIVFLHGAGMDHSVWVLQSRWFSSRGWSVLAPDFPGHGRSGGALLESIAEMADWTAALIEAAGLSRAILVGHSMGALVALEAASRHGDRVSGLALVGAAAAMPVHPDMIASAREGSFDAVAMVSLWGLGAHATQGGAATPGQWMLGACQRLLEAAPAGALASDLIACDDYKGAAQSGAGLVCPTLILSGSRDMMTPLKGAKALAAAIPAARLIALDGAGHMLMIERPDATLDALSDFARQAVA